MKVPRLELWFPVSPPNLYQGFGVNGEYYRANGINIVGHNGLDIQAYHGQPVYASIDGTAFYEEDDSSGHGVVIVSNQEYVSPAGFNDDETPASCFYKTIFWHFCDPVKEPKYASPIWTAAGKRVNSGKGITVKVGDLIGYADSTGMSTGDHLHFGLKPIARGAAPTGPADAPDLGIGSWKNLYPDNGYLGAIDPTPFFNGFYALQSAQVLGILDSLRALLQKYLFSLQHPPQTPLEPVKSPVAAPLPPKPTDLTMTSKIAAWATAIERGEGAAPATHNPGNLKYSPLTASWGATPGRAATDGGHLAQFPDYATGRLALCNFLILGCKDELLAFHQARTLLAFTKIYAGGPPQGYIDGIVAAMGGNPQVDISTFLES